MSISCQQEHFSSKYTSKRSSQGKQCCAVTKIHLKLFADNYCGCFLVLYGIGGDRGNGYRGPCPLGVRTQDFTMEGFEGTDPGIFQKGSSQGVWAAEVPRWSPGAYEWDPEEGTEPAQFFVHTHSSKKYGDALGVG